MPLPWLKLDELYVTPSPARIYSGNVVYVERGVAVPLGPQQAGVWHMVDLVPYGVSPDAKVAFLSGMLLITHGTTPELADLKVVFKRPSDSTGCEKYMGQVIETDVNGGQRSGFASWVPLEDGLFVYCYTVTTPGGYPEHSSYGINLSLQAWGR